MLRDLHDGRFAMWVTVQEYVDRLRPAPAEARRRHARHFATFGSDETMASLSAAYGLRRRKQLGAEIDNLLRACAFAVEHADHDLATRTCRAACEVLRFRGPLAIAAPLAASVLALDNLEERERARVEETLGLILRLSGDPGSQLHFERAVARARALGDSAVEGDALRGLGLVLEQHGQRVEARACFDRALAIAVERGDVDAQVATLTNIGVVHMGQGEHDQALAMFQRALALGRSQGSSRFVCIVLSNLGVIHTEQGRWAEARGAYGLALQLAREIEDRAAEAVVLGNFGNLCFDRGELGEARELLERSLELRRRNGNRGLETTALSNLAGLDLREGRDEEARIAFEQALAIARAVGHPGAEGQALGGLAEVARRRHELDPAASFVAEGEAILRSVADVRELAKLLCTKSRLAYDQNRPDVARQALDEAIALADSLGAGPNTELRQEILRTEAALAPRVVRRQQ
jgi:tetratricopeptide (TPR) repeat protein